MPMFNQSTIVWATAVERIADSAGASADNEMRNRAHISLRAAFQFLGGKHRWDYMRTEAAPIQVIAPFTVTGISASAGQTTAAAPPGHGFLPDDMVLASGLISGMRISATAASGVTFTTAITGLAAGVNVVTATGVRDFYAFPADARILYSARMLNSNRVLRYRGRRLHDRTVGDELASGTPEAYDLFSMGGKGKIRLLPPPAGADVLTLRYYRRFTIASASAISATALDIPEDYEEIPIAWAKWHFLTDKGDGRKDQATTWMSLAQDGLTSMLKEQSNLPDDDLVIVPGHLTVAWPSTNDTRHLDYDYS